jgi:hypothetical protein
MIVEFNLTNLIFVVAGLLSGFWALAKIISRQNHTIVNSRFDTHEKLDSVHYASLEKRLSDIELTAQVESNQWQRVERELLTLKAEIPVHYVRRDDYIRGQSVLEAKIDGLGMKMENAQLRASRAMD